MTKTPEIVTYEFAKSLPIGTIAADAQGYWEAIGRRYLKTTSNTWALFLREPSKEEIAEAISSRRNNLSPAPLGELMNIQLPESAPDLRSTFGRAITADEVGYGRPSVDQLVAEGDRVHAEIEARYGSGSKN